MPDSDDGAALTMYTTWWCPHCRRLKHGLRRKGISWHEIDIETDSAAADFVASVNDGNRTVPTVVYRDGTLSTNPPIREVLAKLGVG